MKTIFSYKNLNVSVMILPKKSKKGKEKIVLTINQNKEKAWEVRDFVSFFKNVKITLYNNET